MKLSSIVFAIAFAWCLTGCSDASSDPSATTSDPSEAADASDASDTTDTSDATDASDESDATDASDGSATADASDASSDDSDTSDPSDASDSSDASEVADASDPSDTVTVTTLDDIRGLDLKVMCHAPRLPYLNLGRPTQTEVQEARPTLRGARRSCGSFQPQGRMGEPSKVAGSVTSKPSSMPSA